MHELAPHHNWQNHYMSEDDPGSPFFEQIYDQFQYSTEIYGYYIDPQWDSIGSKTLYVKVIFVDYDLGSAIIELIGEWNDLLYNDIMYLKRELIDVMIGQGINKFVLLGEHVLSFHSSEDDYYSEWFDEIDESEGYIALLNFRQHVLDDFSAADIDSYFVLGGKLNDIAWRTQHPDKLLESIDELVQKRLAFSP